MIQKIINFFKNIFRRKPNMYQQDQTIKGRHIQSPPNNLKYVLNPNLYFDTSFMGFNFNKLDYYFQMYFSDAQIKNVVDSTTNRVLALDSEIVYINREKGKRQAKAINDYVFNMMNRLQIEKIKENWLFYSSLTGKAPSQISYESDGQYLYPKSIEIRNPDYFDFLSDTLELVYIPQGIRYGTYESLNQLEWIVHTNRGSAINPHGISELGKAVVYLHYYKQTLIEVGLQSAEKNADPPKHVKIKNRNEQTGQLILTDAELDAMIDDLEDGIKELSSNGRIITNDIVDINELRSQVGSSNFPFLDFIEYIDRAISKAVLNSTTTNENSEGTGSRALSQVHERTTESKIESLAKGLEDTINRLIKRFVDLNFENVEEYPYYHINYTKDEYDMQRFDMYLSMIDMGLPINLYQLYQAFDFEIPSFITEDMTTLDLVKSTSNNDDTTSIEDNTEDESEENETLASILNTLKKNISKRKLTHKTLVNQNILKLEKSLNGDLKKEFIHD